MGWLRILVLTTAALVLLAWVSVIIARRARVVSVRYDHSVDESLMDVYGSIQSPPDPPKADPPTPDVTGPGEPPPEKRPPAA